MKQSSRKLEEEVFRRQTSLECVEKGWRDEPRIEDDDHAKRLLCRHGKRVEVSTLYRISREQGVSIARKDSSFAATVAVFLCRC